MGKTIEKVVLRASSLNLEVIERANNEAKMGKIVTIEVPNTKGATSDLIEKINRTVKVRVLGGYAPSENNRLMQQYNDYYIFANIYSRQELISIVSSMEKIESGLKKEWNILEKAKYLYDRCCENSVFKNGDDFYHRSLRTIASKEGCCAGFALSFKELCDRNDIPCEYTEGMVENHNSGHAWNVINFNGKQYIVDMTLDLYKNTNYTCGFANCTDWLLNYKMFCELPDGDAFLEGYTRSSLGHITFDECERINKKLYSKYSNSKFNIMRFKRRDGSGIEIALVGTKKSGRETYYKYAYREVLTSDGRYKPNASFEYYYSNTNIIDHIYSKKLDLARFDIEDVLFGKNNLGLCQKIGTSYIGYLPSQVDCKIKPSPNAVFSLAWMVPRLVSERVPIEYALCSFGVERTPEGLLDFEISNKERAKIEREKKTSNPNLFERKDKTTFVGLKKKDIQVLHFSPFRKRQVCKYELTEVDNEKHTLLLTDIYSEDDDLIIPAKREATAENLLATNRLEKIVSNGGYAGCVDDFGTIYESPEFAEYLKKKYNRNEQNCEKSL